MNEVRQFKLSTLRPHPLQPASRTLDTTGLQASMAKNGQIDPIIVANDEMTVLSGWRRCTAARALGWKSIKGIPSDVDAGSPEAMDVLVASNVQEPLTSMQLVAVLQGYEEHGVDFRTACRRCKIKSAKARTLAALAQAPPEVQQAVDLYDRGDTDKGMSLSAFAQIQRLPGDRQLEILHRGKTSKRAAYRAAKRDKRQRQGQRLVNDARSTDTMLTMAHSMAAQAMTLAAWMNGAEQDDVDLVQIAYASALPALRKLVEEGVQNG